MKIAESSLVTIALLLFACLCCALAMKFAGDAGLLPLAAGITVFVCCAVQFALDLREIAPELPHQTGRGAFVSASLLLAAIYLLGFLIALPLYAALAWKQSGASWRATAAAGAGVLLIIYVGFDLLLDIDLYSGVLLRAVLPR